MYLTAEGNGGAGDRGGAQLGIDELDHVYSFIYARVGNRADAEDLTQQVALKALPRLRDGAPCEAVRGYLFATARSVLAAFWADRYGVPESPLGDDFSDADRGKPPAASPEAEAWLERTLASLPQHYRQVLELRFLRGSSIREVACEMGKTVGAIKLMQLRALRAAGANAGESLIRPNRYRPERPWPASAPDFAFEPPRADPKS